MRRFTTIIVALLLMLFLSTQVAAYTIDDITPIGVGYSNDGLEIYRGTTDFLGAGFDTAGIDVSLAGSMMTIDLFTKFDGYDLAETVGLYLADLFFDTGSGWNFAVDMGTFFTGTGDLYSVVSVKTSEDCLQGVTSGNWAYGRYYEGSLPGPSPIVDMISGVDIGDVNFNRTSSAGNYIYNIVFDAAPLGLIMGDTLGIHWATAYCANDVVIGNVSTVPETRIHAPPGSWSCGSGWGWT